MKAFIVLVWVASACTDGRSPSPDPSPSPHGAMIGRRFWTCAELAEAYQETLAENARLRAELGRPAPTPPRPKSREELRRERCAVRIGADCAGARD